ncbi:lipoprotein-releasing ABC transporter permease subunit [Candidatus Venteria ishoeyi]|uniref:Lipoprotein-releasing system transmembrane protein LolC n=2 Tax=Candidatus Venteria ishoeyi TaxID=1899563 RepID=A0A1H6FFK0_9GAMM|nr:Lipoprotein-releasing system transmembrane protein LolC [Candidatus Venteria ishoeyi]
MMFKPLPFYIGLRYTRAKRRNHFISFISLTSMFGIALGVTALITVLSVMNGFEKELRERMLGMAPHVMVFAAGDRGMADWEVMAKLVRDTPTQVTGIAPYVQGQAMLTHRKRIKGTLFQGIDPAIESEVSQVGDNMKQGSLQDLQPGKFNVLLGQELAMAMGVVVGDKVTVVVPQANITPVGVLPRMKRMTVAGIFEVGMHEFDSSLVLMNIADAARLLRMPKAHVHGINIKITQMFDAPKVSRALVDELPIGYYIQDWTYRHANFFRAIKMEKTVMFVILSLIVGVAAFNIISTLVMVVTDKEADIAILRTLGATPNTIMAIFMVQGSLIGVFGTLLGLVGGVSLALNVETIIPSIEQAFNVQFLDSSVYYISDLPSELNWDDVRNIGILSLLLSLLATLYPARRAAKTQPAEALRYE